MSVVRQLGGSEDALVANFDQDDPADAATDRDRTVLALWRVREELRIAERGHLCLTGEMANHALRAQLTASRLAASPVDPGDEVEARAASSARMAAEVAQDLAELAAGHLQ